MSNEPLVSTLARKFRLEVDSSNVGLAGTAAMATDIVTIAAHGLVAGDEIVFTEAPAPIVVGDTYYVKAPVTVNTFKVSATPTGAVVDISADGPVAAGGNQWLQVRAISEFTPGLDATLEDDSDYDSEGYASQTKTQLAWKLDVKCMRKVGVTSGQPDPGQEVLRRAAEAFGADGVVHVRWYDRDGGPEAYEGLAEVSWSPEGGSTTALAGVSITLTGKGRRNEIDNPAAAA